MTPYSIFILLLLSVKLSFQEPQSDMEDDAEDFKQDLPATTKKPGLIYFFVLHST